MIGKWIDSVDSDKKYWFESGGVSPATGERERESEQRMRESGKSARTELDLDLVHLVTGELWIVSRSFSVLSSFDDDVNN